MQAGTNIDGSSHCISIYIQRYDRYSTLEKLNKKLENEFRLIKTHIYELHQIILRELALFVDPAVGFVLQISFLLTIWDRPWSVGSFSITL